MHYYWLVGAAALVGLVVLGRLWRKTRRYSLFNPIPNTGMPVNVMYTKRRTGRTMRGLMAATEFLRDRDDRGLTF